MSEVTERQDADLLCLPMLTNNVRFKVCLPHLSTSHKSREITASLIVTLIVKVLYYSVYIIWPTMINLFHIGLKYFPKH
jgi:hypothetical protein